MGFWNQFYLSSIQLGKNEIADVLPLQRNGNIVFLVRLFRTFKSSRNLDPVRQNDKEASVFSLFTYITKAILTAFFEISKCAKQQNVPSCQAPIKVERIRKYLSITWNYNLFRYREHNKTINHNHTKFPINWLICHTSN